MVETAVSGFCAKFENPARKFPGIAELGFGPGQVALGCPSPKLFAVGFRSSILCLVVGGGVRSGGEC